MATFVKQMTVKNGLVQNTPTAAQVDSPDMVATGVAAGSYGDAAHTLTVAVDTAGRVTAISANALAGFASLASANTFSVGPQTVTSDADAHGSMVLNAHSAGLNVAQTSPLLTVNGTTHGGDVHFQVNGGAADGMLQVKNSTVLGSTGGASLQINGTSANGNVAELECQTFGTRVFILSNFNNTVAWYGSNPAHMLGVNGNALLISGATSRGGNPGAEKGPLVIEAPAATAVNPFIIVGQYNGSAPNAHKEWARFDGTQIGLRGLSSTSTVRKLGGIAYQFVVSTDASYTGRLTLNATDFAGDREGLRVEATGAAAALGFYGAAAVTKPAVTGAKGGNAALASLLAALATLGLITDSTTA